VESVVPPPVVTTKQGKFSINLPVKILPIWKKSKRIQRKTTNLNQTKVKVFDDNQPEIELLLCCARTQPSSEISRQIQNLVQQNIDWDFLLQTAARHSVLPLLYQNLKTLCPEAVPKPVLSELRNFFHTNAAHNLFRTQELIKILKLFQDNDIPAIPFKGPALAASVYGNLALRQFGDLDILVHERDFLKAEEFLLLQKYESISQYEWEHSWFNDSNKICIDIHQGLAPSYFPFHLDFDHFWQRSESVSLTDIAVPNLCPEDLLLVLCLQIAKDSYDKRAQLSKICDLDQLLYVHPEMDWGQITEEVKQDGSERLLFFGLSLTSEMLGTSLPDKVKQIMQADRVVKINVAMAKQQLFSKVEFPTRGWEMWKRRLMLISSPPAKGITDDKITFLWSVRYWIQLAMTPTEGDYATLSLPRSVHFIYYLIRPMRLFIKHFKGG
jgi:hypothetical protein